MEQFKKYIDGNDSLVRLSLLMNQFTEEELFETFERCMDHPNLEVLQIVDKIKKPEDDIGDGEDDEDEAPKPRKGKGKGKEVPARDKGLNATKLSLCKGIQIRLQQNESLKKIEIRFIVLNRKFLEAVFIAMANNRTLQKLIMTNEVLKLATAVELKLLGDALKDSTSMLMVDLSNNSSFDYNLEFHESITEPLINTSSLKLRKIVITTRTVDVKAHYLEVIDQKQGLIIYVNGKELEDVDVHE